MKRIGVAVGQTITRTATPLETLQAKAGQPNWDQVVRLVKKWAPDAMVVGIPLNMDGTDQPITAKAQQFAEMLSTHCQLPIYKVDERLTTKDAKQRLFSTGGYKALQRGQIDSVAAQLILQNWFADYLK